MNTLVGLPLDVAFLIGNHIDLATHYMLARTCHVLGRAYGKPGSFQSQDVLLSAVANGHTGVVAWLFIDTFGFSNMEDIHEVVTLMVYEASSNGRLAILQWMYQIFGRWVFDFVPVLAKTAVMYGRLDIVEWMIDMDFNWRSPGICAYAMLQISNLAFVAEAMPYVAGANMSERIDIFRILHHHGAELTRDCVSYAISAGNLELLQYVVRNGVELAPPAWL